MKTYTFEEMKDKHLGKQGTLKREAYENELRQEILGQTIKEIRQERNLTQEQMVS